MTLKTKMSLLVFLTTVSIVSVGFSSWSITAETQAEIGGRIEVDNVIESLSYIDMKEAPSFLVYGKEGFVNSDGKYVKNAGFNANFEINIANCKDYFLDLDSIIVDVTLSHNAECVFASGKGLFDNYTVKYNNAVINTTFKFTYVIKINDVEIELTSNELIKNGNEFSINFPLTKYYTIDDNSPDKIDLSISYNWYLDDINGYFEDKIYPIIYNTSTNTNILDFSIGVTLTGN